MRTIWRGAYNNWRVRWKKGVRYFTQNRTLSKTLQISHAVLFRCLKQCSACFFPWSLLPFWDITYAKKHIFPRVSSRDLLLKEKLDTFWFAKRWSHYNTFISYYCFVSASDKALNGPDSNLFCRDTSSIFRSVPLLLSKIKISILKKMHIGSETGNWLFLQVIVT